MYLLLFSASALVLFAFIYWSTAGFMERQTLATINAEIQGLRERYELLGLAGLIQVINERVQVNEAQDSLYLLTNARLHPLAGNLEEWPNAAEVDDGWIHFHLEDDQGGPARTATARHFLLRGNFHLLVGRDTSEKSRIQSMIMDSLFWGLAITVVLGLLGGLFMSRSMLRRLDVINRAIQEIVRGDLTRRIPLTGSARSTESADEFDRLVLNVNEMLDQIERLMRGFREVSDNIAHDLRSPLNRIRGRLEVSLLGAPDAETLRRTIEDSIQETDELLHTFNALLRIAQAEAGSRRGDETLFDLSVAARDLAELYEPLAEEQGLAFSTHLTDRAMVLGNRHLLSQALANLLDNAMKYTPEGGAVTLTVRLEEGRPVCEVRDTGPGVPEPHRERVLERFYRLESSRSAPGAGLGLSLVAAVAKLHRAALMLTDNAPGLVVTLRFPKPPAAAPAPVDEDAEEFA